HQPHGLKRKSRKCSESAQKTYGYSYAPFGWDGQMPHGILSDPAEQKTSEQIYDQGTGGETGASALLHQGLQSVACQRAQSAENDQQSNAHSISFLCAPLRPTKTPGAGRRPGVISPSADGLGELHRLLIFTC